MNEQQTKAFLGKILGEVYRIQRHLEIPNAPDTATVYGLLNGIEAEIDQQLEHVGFVSTAKLDVVEDVLDEFDQSETKMEAFKGFYDIERRLSDAGVSRVDAMRIFRYLKANDRFISIIDKMDSSHSPSELRNSDIRDDEV